MRQMVFNINSEHAKISEVIPGLFISGVCALTPAIIAANNIDVIINTTEEVPNVKSLGKVDYVKLSLKDTPETNIYPHFHQLCEKIERTMKDGKNVLIHSVQGVSRCATFCLAYIMKAHTKSLKDAYELLKSKRVMIKINEGFWKQLANFEEEIKRLKDKCFEGSTSSEATAKSAEEAHTSNTSSADKNCSTESKQQNERVYESITTLSNYSQTDTLASFAQVFYREIKRRTKCRRKITPVFQPVLETLYEQAETVA